MEQDAIDAARYRFLREQHWSDAQLCVVENPKRSLYLGSRCPSREELDEAIDDAMRDASMFKAAGL